MNRVLRTVIFAVFSVLPVASAHAADASTGKWVGPGFQLRPNGKISSWSIEVTVDAGGNATAIDYPSLKCGGRLTYLRTTGEFREYRETLDHGAKRCTNNGTVGIRPKLGKLVWYWTGDGTANPNGVDVAVLVPKSP